VTIPDKYAVNKGNWFPNNRIPSEELHAPFKLPSM